MPLHYRENTTDEKVIQEILIKKAYKKKKIDFDVSSEDVWLDGGAQIGVFAEYAALKGCKKIYCYEPEESNFELLNKNTNWLVEKYGIDIYLHKEAITQEPGEALLHIAPNTWRHAINTHYKKELKKQKINCVAFDSILEKYDDINAIKLDIEGSELEILNQEHDYSKINKLVFEYSFTKNRDMKYFFQCVDILKKDFEVDIQKSYYNQKHNGVKGYWGGFIDQIIYCKK